MQSTDSGGTTGHPMSPDQSKGSPLSSWEATKTWMIRWRGSRQLVLVIVAIALLLDNMLLTVVGKYKITKSCWMDKEIQLFFSKVLEPLIITSRKYFLRQLKHFIVIFKKSATLISSVQFYLLFKHLLLAVEIQFRCYNAQYFLALLVLYKNPVCAYISDLHKRTRECTKLE